MVSVILCNKHLTISGVHNWKKKKQPRKCRFHTADLKKSYPNSSKRKASFNGMYRSREVIHKDKSLLQRNSNRILAIISNLICVICKTWIANDFVLLLLGIWILPYVKTAVLARKKSEIIFRSWIKKKKSHKTFTLIVLYKISLITGSSGTLLLVP